MGNQTKEKSLVTRVTLDEQIAYVKQQIDWYTGKVNNGRPSWNEEVDAYQAILESLRKLKRVEA